MKKKKEKRCWCWNVIYLDCDRIALASVKQWGEIEIHRFEIVGEVRAIEGCIHRSENQRGRVRLDGSESKSKSKGEGKGGRRTEARGTAEIGTNGDVFGGVCGESGDWSHSHNKSHINTHFISQPYQYISVSNVPLHNCSTASALVPEPSAPEPLDMHAFLHPPNLTHKLSDEDLFWRASLMANKEEYPYRRVPKVAFMFLTRGPLPMLPLWERFFQGHHSLFNIYIHAPPLHHLNVSQSSPFYARHIPSQLMFCVWGSTWTAY